jgi:hypothetical protein
MKAVRFLIGLLLLPVCVALTQTAVTLILSLNPTAARLLSPSLWALAGGFVLWLVIYLTLPRPMQTYILGHELTHALWAWLLGALVYRIRVSDTQGSVSLSRSNFLITLSPYFFPLYTVLVIAAYYALSVFYDVQAYAPAWLALVGFTWGFHFTFTIASLLQRQSDIRAYGRVCAYAVIYGLNVLGICLWVVMVSSATLEQMLQALARHAQADALAAWALARRLPGWLHNKRRAGTLFE